MAGMTAILPCTCNHISQDALYGKGRRLHNWARKAMTNGAWRCTVCLGLKGPTGTAQAPSTTEEPKKETAQ